MAVTCEKCGKNIRENAKVCMWCGERTSSAEIPIQCSKCGQMMPPRFDACQYCGEVLWRVSAEAIKVILMPLIPPFEGKGEEGIIARNHLAKSRELIQAGKYQEALPLIEKALLHSPENMSALVAKTMVYFLLDYYQDGTACLNRLIELEPGNAAWPQARVQLYKLMVDAKNAILPEGQKLSQA